MSGTGLTFLVIFFILIISVISVILIILYNKLVKWEESVNEAWAQVATLFQRKVDLIPALLEAVKDYSSHEKETLESVTSMRSQAQKLIEKIERKVEKVDEIEESQNALDNQLSNIRVLAEKYPDLKASVNFLKIQQQLEETEDKITQARQHYNTSVKDYNASMRLFPFSLMTMLFQSPSRDYFKA